MEPTTLILRPGLSVLRRDAETLQVGLEAPWRLVVREDRDVRRLLDDLAAGRPPRPTTGLARATLERLQAAGMLVEVPEGPGASGMRPALARHGTAGQELWQRRSETLVLVDGSGSWAGLVHDLLATAGCRSIGADDLADGLVAVEATDGSGAPAAAAVVVQDGPLSRSRLDDLIRTGVPHVPVEGGPVGVRIGPFVAPGTTACLRCLDAEAEEHDPRRALVLEQAAGDPRARGVTDPTLLGLAICWAVHDVVAFLDGGVPASWSTTIDVTQGPEIARRVRRRHPHCGCGWDRLAVG